MLDTNNSILTKMRTLFGTLDRGKPVTVIYNRPKIFVFGSNLKGLHGGGAAKYAYDHYGAVWGVGEGRTGDSYALPTCIVPGVKQPVYAIKGAFARFARYAAETPHCDFLLTAVGAGLAGYTPEQIGDMMIELPDNVYIQARLASWYTG